MNRSNATVAIVLTVALAVVLGWFFTTFERHQETVDTGYGPEARRNPMLAGARMLRMLGIPAGELEPGVWTDKLEAGRGTLFVFSSSWTLGDKEVDKLFDWVRSGGHLVIAAGLTARSDDDASDDDTPDGDGSGGDGSGGSNMPGTRSGGKLLDSLGIRQRAVPASANVEAVRAPLPVSLGKLNVEVRFPTRVRLVTRVRRYRITALDEHGACLIDGEFGRGHFTALCTMRAFQNTWIDEVKNATLLYTLATVRPPGEPLWFIFDTDMPPLHQWLWQHVPQTVCVALVAMVLWLWSLTRRAGPMQDLAPRGNRRTLEHVEASGRFVWRHEGANALLAAMRREFAARLDRRHPGWNALPEAERYQRLSRLSGLAPEDVFRALGVEPSSKPHFIDAVRHLQRLRESI